MIEVSVVIPTYNSEQYIKHAIDSALLQNVEKEIIVVDDASTDNTRELLNCYIQNNNIIYIRNKENLGVAESRNIGIRLAKGDYIAFLDADDWWDKNKLEQQISYMKKYGYLLSGTARELVSEKGEVLNKFIPVQKHITYRELLHHNSLVCSSVVLNKELALKVPMEHSDLHEDYLVWLKVLRICGEACGINKPLVYYRMTKNGKSRRRIKSAIMTYKVYRILGFGRVKSMFYLTSHLLNGIKKYY